MKRLVLHALKFFTGTNNKDQNGCDRVISEAKSRATTKRICNTI